jgi:hypothetical protein
MPYFSFTFCGSLKIRHPELTLAACVRTIALPDNNPVKQPRLLPETFAV